MFSGIVESVVNVNKIEGLEGLIRIWVERPSEFNDIKLGDSISNNGVCLTVESFDENEIQFAIAHETLKVTGWDINFLQSKPINLERSLSFGDRVHGHLVTGHVEDMAVLKSKEEVGESTILKFTMPESMFPFLWKKGSVAINGVSLTINAFENTEIELCIIPETIKRTNLSLIEIGDKVCVEPDYFARAVYHWRNSENVE